MNGHAMLYTGVTLAFWSTILIIGKADFLSRFVCLFGEIGVRELNTFATI